MPPSPSDNARPPSVAQVPSREKEVLHAKFSRAAAALTDLFKESTDAYEAGYHDALLYVHRYILLASAQPEEVVDESTRADAGPARCPLSALDAVDEPQIAEERPGGYWPAAPALSPRSTVSSEKLLRFLQNTVQRRKARVALERGTTERRRQTRSTENAHADCGGTTDSDSDAEQNTHTLTLPPATPSLQLTRSAIDYDDGAEAGSDRNESTGSETSSSRRRERQWYIARLCEQEATADLDEPPRQLRRCVTPLASQRRL